MKVLASVAALAAAFALAGPAVSAELKAKEKGTNAQGSNVGVFSSQVTGNGDVIGGNGATGRDQTTYPGSRADEVQGIQAEEGRGRDKDDAQTTDE